jgi:hypothetical protein
LPRSAALAVAATVALLMAAVGGSSISAGAGETTRPRPAGPSAAFSDISGGNGVFLGDPIPVNLKRAGYVEQEYAASGTATSYTQTSPLAEDGRWSLAPDGTAPYRTRVLVRRPSDPARFSGTVVVEWLNVSGGVDADPEWSTTHEELLRRGDAWVGVSTQRIGVEGGPVLVQVDVPGSEAAGQGLKAIDPARYGSLEQPGDGFSFDIYTQAARAVRSGAGMAGLRPKRVIAAGESQSAFALVTYYNGVQPLTHAFDGFFVHSRGGGGLPLVGAGEAAGIANAIGGTPTTFRTDQDAPVLDLQTETDLTSVLNSYVARQPDNRRFRLWEVPGTAHADAHLLGSTAQYIQCAVPINNGPLHVVAKAGLRALTTWVDTGKTPPKAARIDVASGASPQIQRNADGIALGGIRTPPVDVPVAALSGAPGPNPSVICLLLGSTEPFSAGRLAQLYPSRAEYKKQYDRAADAAIKAGFVLPEDRAALLEFAEPSVIQG